MCRCLRVRLHSCAPVHFAHARGLYAVSVSSCGRARLVHSWQWYVMLHVGGLFPTLLASVRTEHFLELPGLLRVSKDQ